MVEGHGHQPTCVLDQVIHAALAMDTAYTATHSNCLRQAEPPPARKSAQTLAQRRIVRGVSGVAHALMRGGRGSR